MAVVVDHLFKSALFLVEVLFMSGEVFFDVDGWEGAEDDFGACFFARFDHGFEVIFVIL